MDFQSRTFLWIIIGLIVTAITFWSLSKSISKPQNTPTPQVSPTFPTPIASPTALTLPVSGFYNRITKKPFGIYVTPQNSPVQPEHFTGYHTGADVEYEDITTNVPVYAVADGTVLISRTAQGYGGVIIIRHTIGNESFNALYGHLRPSTLPTPGTKVKTGQEIALLGTGYSPETDGERRHLHFAVLKDDSRSLLGYVQNKSELSNWYDPVEFMRTH